MCVCMVTTAAAIICVEEIRKSYNILYGQFVYDSDSNAKDRFKTIFLMIFSRLLYGKLDACNKV